ncbi:toxin coregulated pilus biosynthesis protein T [Psychromonas marina]|uniref:Toxin coregulated pilus biosynthesis protein T n=1 Tax=Psychromonas marina TaxID=88364 RepID=A0ABQ6E3N2_9GAMM|nr:ATPase, T2SS/T4P/T4SS family [Psychromonas marina]GLS91813.1 toxin coregulated pilus biosynthesis protein T [Psychromonas marina]
MNKNKSVLNDIQDYLYLGDVIYSTDEFYLLKREDHISVVFIVGQKQPTVRDLFYALNPFINTNSLIEYYQSSKGLFDSYKYFNSQKSAGARSAENLSALEVRFHELVMNAMKKDASDIHVFRGDFKVEIWFRIQGKLVFIDNVPPFEMDSMLGVFFNVLANEKRDVWNRRYLQDSSGVLNFKNNESIKVRYSHSPIESANNQAYHAVLRILKSRVVERSGDKRGSDHILIPKTSLEQNICVKRIASSAMGLFVVAGTTGSGKSSSINKILGWLYEDFHHRDVSIVTVEDPVEYEILGAAQTSVLRSVGDESDKGAFTKYLASAMRRDPDILLIGETRDAQTADVLAESVESGHFVITTLHAGGVISTISRLNSLGISYSRLASPDFIAGIMCQKLIPTLCECSIPLEKYYEDNPNDRLYTLLQGYCEVNEFTMLRVQNFDGCKRCGGSGVAGRQIVIELLTLSEEMLDAIKREDFIKLKMLWVNQGDGIGGVTLFQGAFNLMLQGVVCPIELEKSFGIFDHQLKERNK